MGSKNSKANVTNITDMCLYELMLVESDIIMICVQYVLDGFVVSSSELLKTTSDEILVGLTSNS